MNRFVIKLLIFGLSFSGLICAFSILIPKDDDSYFNEYNKKASLLESDTHHKTIIVGGSSVAFDICSKIISDSLKTHAVNFGLTLGIGIKYPLEDALTYVNPGDVIVCQIEYENFLSGGDGDSDGLPRLMVATNWRKIENLNQLQWSNILLGMPKVAIGNLIRFLTSPIRTNNSKAFEFRASGFNQYGDEVSHFNYPNTPVSGFPQKSKADVNMDFVKWLRKIVDDYEKKGCQVVMIPPTCISSYFFTYFNDDRIEKALQGAGIPYVVDPRVMVYDDKYSFDGGPYHLNYEGVLQNTIKLIEIIKNNKRTQI